MLIIIAYYLLSDNMASAVLITESDSIIVILCTGSSYVIVQVSRSPKLVYSGNLYKYCDWSC